ncbi:hypothetical protein EBB59_04860 [Lysobacter pythonis]|uniref:Uncharacterized protein n=2 Tax=Solilutibacter pythonis TaxID=2483112 RepID=A0A3M2HZN5_9GAMM|nr:hypothetical protein EBB59_04860 [Lysobacter pythonis]
MHRPTSRPAIGGFHALAGALAGGFRHWRLLLLWWLAGLLPAALAAQSLSSLMNRAFGFHPEAGRIAADTDVAALADGLMGLGDNAANAFSGVLSGTAFAFLLATLLAPWAAGMLVASLREGRALAFGELWLGGWREYGRMLRLWLVALLPSALAGMTVILAFIWAWQGEERQILEATARQRGHIALAIAAIAGLLVYANLEAGRAAFVRDPALRSAFHAWLRGLRLLCQRPFAVLLAVALTLAASLALNALPLMAAPAHASGTAMLLATQLAVLAMGWLRVARLSALSAITPASTPPAR